MRDVFNEGPLNTFFRQGRFRPSKMHTNHVPSTFVIDLWHHIHIPNIKEAQNSNSTSTQ